MPHCVMRRPQAGAELGLEDPGELMPRSVEGNLRGKEDKQTSKRETKEQQKYEKKDFVTHLPSVRHDSSVRRPVAGLAKIVQSGEKHKSKYPSKWGRSLSKILNQNVF